jgi:amidohydrolase
MYNPSKVTEAIREFHGDLTEIRRDIHTNPEHAYKETRTAAIVAERLKAYGVDEVHTGIGGTGVVGVIRGNRPGKRAVGLRADMDCLAMNEETRLPYASKNQGYMHACGHDGHTTMGLGRRATSPRHATLRARFTPCFNLQKRAWPARRQ